MIKCLHLPSHQLLPRAVMWTQRYLCYWFKVDVQQLLHLPQRQPSSAR